jgi:hypothetical protein
MKEKGWFLVPRRGDRQFQRSHNLAPLIERLRQLARPERAEPRTRSASAPKWFEHPRRRTP